MLKLWAAKKTLFMQPAKGRLRSARKKKPGNARKRMLRQHGKKREKLLGLRQKQNLRKNLSKKLGKNLRENLWKHIQKSLRKHLRRNLQQGLQGSHSRSYSSPRKKQKNKFYCRTVSPRGRKAAVCKNASAVGQVHFALPGAFLI